MHDREKTSAELSTVNVNITEFYASPICLWSDAGAKVLSKNSFSSTHVTSYDYSLCHPIWATRDKAEELHKQAVLGFPVRQLLRNVVYVKLSLILEYTLTRPQVSFLSEWKIPFRFNTICLSKRLINPFLWREFCHKCHATSAGQQSTVICTVARSRLEEPGKQLSIMVLWHSTCLNEVAAKTRDLGAKQEGNPECDTIPFRVQEQM